jgi:hypothetical protein
MIDYFAHTAVLEQVRNELASVTDSTLLEPREKLLADALTYPEAAQLGALVDHLMTHVSGTEAELELLGRAAELWKEGRSIYDAAGEIRSAVQESLADPTAPAALAAFNQALSRLVGLRAKLLAIQAGMDIVGGDATQWRHLPTPHPRQRNATISQWDWRDRFLARRTDAFVRATFKYAKDSRLSTVLTTRGN